MSEATNQPSAGTSCWNVIGVWGDGECSELKTVGHCRNCHVYVSAGRTLLDRPVPDDYVDLWTDLLAEDQRAAAAATSPYVVFRIGRTWFGLRATTFREITEPKAIRSIPHRPAKVLLGLVNVRGELYPCVSLHALVGETAHVLEDRPQAFMLLRRDGEEWVFRADEVDGMYPVAEASLEPVPATLAHADAIYTRALFRLGEKTVAIMDEELVFGALRRGLA
jgi:chemotaxis-related protein WspD